VTFLLAIKSWIKKALTFKVSRFFEKKLPHW